jgi:hypothetical protein
MASKIQQLRKLVEKGISNETGHRVKKMTVHNELTYIENRHLENYFIVAHKLMKQLKTSEDILIGPGRGRMISSHVCYTLGITNICPQCVFAEHVLLWGDATKNPIIDIEVDNDSYNLVYKQAIEMFGFENVARMPIKISPSFIPNNHEWIGVKSNGEKVYLHACALLICLDGVSNHFAVDEVLDEVGNRILCAKEFIEECDNQSILRYNVLKSNLLTRIKQIQRQIEKNGKQYSKIYEKRLWEEDYELFINGNLNGIPYFESNSIQEVIRMLMPKRKYTAFDELLNIQALFTIKVGNFLQDKEKLAEYKKKHEQLSFLGIFPYGFLYDDDIVWFLNGWIGFSWKQSAEVMQLVFSHNETEAQDLKQFYLQQGMNRGFKKVELNRIWKSIFRYRIVRSRAHYAGQIYLSVYLAGLKHQFPEEFNEIKD